MTVQPRSWTLTGLAAAVLAMSACTGDDTEETAAPGGAAVPGALYALDDDLRVWRWEPATGELRTTADAGAAWAGARGDAATVLFASFTVSPTGRHAVWIAGGDQDVALTIADLETGEVRRAAGYPLDHACVDPAWAPDGAAVTVHRSPVWGPEGSSDQWFREVFGDLEWVGVDGTPHVWDAPSTVEGCRLRWYTGEDGRWEGVLHSLDVRELHRIDLAGAVVETVALDELPGVRPHVAGLVDVDPDGRFACLVDGWNEHPVFHGSFGVRPHRGSVVVGLDGSGGVADDCLSLHGDGYLAVGDDPGASVRFSGYSGEEQWSARLPEELRHAPLLAYVPDSSQ